jgi:F-type H+-transporting ATPase subunit b
MIRRMTLAVSISFAMLLGSFAVPAGALADDPPKDHVVTEAVNGVESSGPTDAHGAGHGHHEDPSKTFNFFHLNYWGKDRYAGTFGDGVEGPHAAPEEKMSAPFILMVVNFGLLLIILAKFGGPAARKMAESRSDLIKIALDEAAALRSKAAAKLAEYETRLADADAEINKMVENMRADAATEKERIAANAATAAAAMQRDAEQRIAAEIERARFELRAEVTAAAAAAAEKLLAQKTSAADQTKLFEQFIGDMQQVAPRATGSTVTSKERS